MKVKDFIKDIIFKNIMLNGLCDGYFPLRGIKGGFY
jgi:hypothetical protein